ncbi:tautomerase family protein [Candidatus Aerophobetes bacterium]|nr:tautomerase family protein [Candidatus Aerophobetes bacterium]
MPVVNITSWPMDSDRKAKVIKKITDAFVEVGIPAEGVTVIINDLPKENWGTGGEQHSVKFKDVG